MIRFKFTLRVWLLFLVLGLISFSIARAQSNPDTNSPIKIQLQTYPSQIAAGQHLWVAVTITLNSGWHIYGNPKGPGPGLPTTIEATSLPEGVQTELPRLLPAEKLVQPDLEPDEWVWAYKEKTTIYVRLSTPSGLPSGSYQVGLRLRALLCREGLCMPHQADLVTPLTIVSDKSAMGTIPQKVQEEIQRTHPAKSRSTLQPAFTGPTPVESIKDLPVQLTEIPELQPRPLHRSLEVRGLLKAALFALLAGLILNFTPCVLPVVSLKVLSFVQEPQEGKGQSFLMGLSFAAGILLVFLVLAALASFAGYGWGQQFQKQPFLIAMIGLVFTMSLSLFGLFQFSIPKFAVKADTQSQHTGYWGSFYRGTLATFLATPCSGPLLGGALAWTLLQPPPLIFAIFTCMGLGMAFPYVLISIVPGALSWLPRFGPWLIHFERLMGFALLATVVYLLTLVPANWRIWVVLFCLFLAIGFYVWGQMTTLSDSSRRRFLVRFVAVILMVAGGWLSLGLLPSLDRQENLPVGESTKWQPYTEMKLLAAVTENRWVVVDFTADWCANCILLEKTVFRNRRLLQAFQKHNVLLMKADLTRENPPAKRLLQKLGSRSIPFLALFPPGERFWQPFFLRDLYRVEDVLRAFKMAVQKPSK